MGTRSTIDDDNGNESAQWHNVLTGAASQSENSRNLKAASLLPDPLQQNCQKADNGVATLTMTMVLATDDNDEATKPGL